jgi:magnesium chelatase family protein
MMPPLPGEASSAFRGRVAQVRDTQPARQHKPNALLGTREIDRHCATNRDGDQLLRHALARLLLSARAYQRVLRVARTIAALAAGTATEH